VAGVRTCDTVARLGGDEFLILLPQIVDVCDAQKIAHNLILALAEPFHLREEVTHVSASIGITFYPDDADNLDTLIKNADQAMYVSKQNGRNRVSNFTIALNEAAQKRLRLTNDLRVALVQGQFRIYFQPIVNLVTGRVGKAEALLRWQHPTQGMINPMDFIPLAEETRLIIDIGEWVRKECAGWCRHWNDIRPDGFQISVNQSPVEFTDEGKGNCVEHLLGYLRECGLPGSAFVVEITEGLLLNEDPRVTSKLAALRDAGVQVAIDDFGTGYSSLSYLRKFDIDYLKIDQSFIRNMQHDSNDFVLCEAIIVMAHKLGLKVVAEGVETVQQRDLLIRSGCDYAQGFLFSRPVAPEQLDVWLQAEAAAAAVATQRPHGASMAGVLS
jgi:EAL domain-containing protein (putative c-di-GMP-specific phosphodiesterase class I)